MPFNASNSKPNSAQPDPTLVKEFFFGSAKQLLSCKTQLSNGAFHAPHLKKKRSQKETEAATIAEANENADSSKENQTDCHESASEKESQEVTGADASENPDAAQLLDATRLTSSPDNSQAPEEKSASPAKTEDARAKEAMAPKNDSDSETNSLDQKLNDELERPIHQPSEPASEIASGSQQDQAPPAVEGSEATATHSNAESPYETTNADDPNLAKETKATSNPASAKVLEKKVNISSKQTGPLEIELYCPNDYTPQADKLMISPPKTQLEELFSAVDPLQAQVIASRLTATRSTATRRNKAQASREERSQQVSRWCALRTNLQTHRAISEQLSAKLSADNPNKHELELIVSMDAALCLKIFSIANSHFYEDMPPARALGPALERIGVDGLKNLCEAWSTLKSSSMSKETQKLQTRMHLHNFVSSQFAQLLCMQAGSNDENKLAQAALYSQLGEQLLLEKSGAKYMQLMHHAAESKRSLLELECEYYGIDHIEITRKCLGHRRGPTLAADLLREISLHSPHSQDAKLLLCAQALAQSYGHPSLAKDMSVQEYTTIADTKINREFWKNFSGTLRQRVDYIQQLLRCDSVQGQYSNQDLVLVVTDHEAIHWAELLFESDFERVVPCTFEQLGNYPLNENTLLMYAPEASELNNWLDNKTLEANSILLMPGPHESAINESCEALVLANSLSFAKLKSNALEQAARVFSKTQLEPT